MNRIPFCLAAGLAIGSCQVQPPSTVPVVAASSAACLMPLQAGEGDIVVRDLTLMVGNGAQGEPHGARFSACIVSDRYDGLRLVNLRIAVLRGTPQPLVVTWHGDNGIPYVSPAFGRAPGSPKLVALVTADVPRPLPTVEAPFTAVVELTYRLCQPSRDNPCELRSVRISPVRVYHQLAVPVAF